MTFRKVSVTYKEAIRLVKKNNTLDLTSLGPIKVPELREPFWQEALRDLREFWQHSYGVVRLYLTPEEANRERMLFGTSLLVVFFTAMGFLGVSQAMRLVHVSEAEQTRLQALPGTLQDILAHRRLKDLPQVFQAVDDFLTTLDQHVAPGQASFYNQSSVLQEIGLVRQSLRALTEAGRESTPLLVAATTFMQDMQQMESAAVRKKYGSLTSYMEMQWRVVKEKVYPHLVVAKSRLDRVHLDTLPGELRGHVEQLRTLVTDVTRLVETLDAHMPAILATLGSEAPRTYAILLQNSHEMRATGGFIGSFAMVKLNDGWVEYLTFRDVYDVDGQIFEDVPPPPGIETISRSFSLRDSNYWPDFPTSAKQVAWFLDKDKGPGVDGVFAISDEVVTRLLRVTGPVQADNIKVPVTAENFMTLMSFLVESKQNKENPKSALFDFAEAFLPQLTQTALTNPAILQALGEAVEDRLLLAYAFDPKVQRFFEEAGLAGTLYHPAMETASGTVMDFFMPVFTATGGNKSDRYMEQQLTHDTRVTEEGKLQNQVTLVRRHTWNRAEEDRVRDLVRQAVGLDISDRVLEILGAERNRHYVRFLVPKGARLVTQEGVEKVKVSEDMNYTVFGFEMSVPAGKETRVKITYELPDSVQIGELGYHLVLQKQPGGDTLPVTKTMTPTRRAVVMADTAGYNVVADSGNLALDIRPQQITLRNIWNGGYLLRID